MGEMNVHDTPKQSYMSMTYLNTHPTFMLIAHQKKEIIIRNSIPPPPMDPKLQFLMFFKLLILCISFCNGGRPLLDSANSDNPPNIQPIFPFSPEFATANAEPHYHEPERKSKTEPELDSYALPPASEPSWQPDMTNAGKWLPFPVPFFPVPGNPPIPFFPPFPVQGTPVIPPGAPFASAYAGLQQLRGWAEISNPSQPRMPIGSFFRARIAGENN